MNNQQEPIPSLGRMMVFIDGENLVHRFQAMVDSGRKPHNDVTHEKDILVWRSGTVRPGLNQVIRANYYTYAYGDDNKITKLNEQIKGLTYNQYSASYAELATYQLLRNLSPKVFRKIRGKKAKGVDIQLTVDILTNVYMDNLDTVYLISGDGDFKPIIEEAQRHGKHVYVAALPSGLNSELKYIADNFIDLEHIYFESIEAPES